MSGARLVRRLAERRIRQACRRLPADVRDERYLEWTAELPAILDDPAGSSWVVRAARVLRYSAGTARASRRLRRASGTGQPHRRSTQAMPWRTGAPPPAPRGPAFRATAGVAIWLIFVVVVVSLIRGLQPSFAEIMAGLVAAAAFVAFCLVDLVRAGEVRYLPKWVWALACLLSVPLGGLMYISIGRVPRRRFAGHDSSTR